jgi:hypothetical protein
MTINTQEQWIYRIPSSYFVDPDGNTLILSATQMGSTTLPTFLKFDATTWTFYAMPDFSCAGSYSISISISDGVGGLNSDTFTLLVNSKPVVSASGPIPTQNITQGATKLIIGTYFTEYDAGDYLTYTI